MTLNNILKLVFSKTHIILLIFISVFLLLKNTDFFEKRYEVHSAIKLGSGYEKSFYSDPKEFEVIFNSQEYKTKVKLNEGVRYKVILLGERNNFPFVVITGNNKLSILKDREKFLSIVQDYEEPIIEKVVELYNHRVSSLKKDIEFYKNMNLDFLYKDKVNSQSLERLLKSDRAVDRYKNLSSSEDRLKKLLIDGPYRKTHYKTDLIDFEHYFPNNIFYIGMSLIAVLLYIALIIFMQSSKKQSA